MQPHCQAQSMLMRETRYQSKYLNLYTLSDFLNLAIFNKNYFLATADSGIILTTQDNIETGGTYTFDI